MSELMDAAVYYGPRDVRIERQPKPVPAPGELLLRVGTVGVCGTDAGEWDHGPVQHPVAARHPASGHLGPVIPGHEFSGTVEAVGADVDPEWIGRRVASSGSVSCGRCDPCLRGQSNQCRRYVGVGLHRHGALAGYVTTPAASSVAVDGLGISLDEAALCQPMSIAVHCVARAGDVAGQLVLVLGSGGIGAFLVYALVQAGAQVIAADLDAERLAIARELGAHETVLVRGEPDDSELLRAAAGDRELRVVFEVSGTAGGLATAAAVTGVGARIVAVGIQRAPVTVDLGSMTVREKTIIGTNAMVHATDFPPAVELIARRAGNWSVIAPRVLPLADLVEGAIRPLAEHSAPAIKVLIDPWARHARDLATRESERTS